MVTRQLPRIAELRELMQFKKPELDLAKRRLDSALTIADLRRIAKRRTPRAAFDYTDGAAEGELSLARARQAFEDIEFHPDILRPAADVDTSVEVLGGPSALPFGIAPTGFTRLMQTEGEIAGASAAGAAGIPFTLSTLGTTSIENVRAANPHGRNWFQLYVMRDREISYGLARRAADAIERRRSFVVVPWQMRVVAAVMRALPNAVYDRLAARRPRKPRVSDSAHPGA